MAYSRLIGQFVWRDAEKAVESSVWRQKQQTGPSHATDKILPLFTTSFNQNLSVESWAEHLSGDGGAIVQRELLERSGIISWLMARLEDTRCSQHVTYSLAELLRTRFLLLAQGWRDQDDADALRYDPAF